MTTFETEKNSIEGFIKMHKNFDFEVWEEKSEGQSIIRLYLTSKKFGLMAGSNKPGIWVPIYPALDKKSYPTKGQWYSPSRFGLKSNTWQNAVSAAFNPKKYLNGQNSDQVGRRIAKDRTKHHNILRVAAIEAVLQGYHN